jgi:hypothetical protein
VVAVNKEVTAPDGNVVTEFDIETRNAVIQVKSGGGKGLAKQVLLIFPLFLLIKLFFLKEKFGYGHRRLLISL